MQLRCGMSTNQQHCIESMSEIYPVLMVHSWEDTNYEAHHRVDSQQLGEQLHLTRQSQSPAINGALQIHTVYPMPSPTLSNYPLQCINLSYSYTTHSPMTEGHIIYWKMSHWFGLSSSTLQSRRHNAVDVQRIVIKTDYDGQTSGDNIRLWQRLNSRRDA